MAAPVTETGQYTNMSESALVRTGSGQLMGIGCASASAGTIKVWDNTSAAGSVIFNTATLIPGTYLPIPATFTTGLYVTIGGTADITVFWNA